MPRLRLIASLTIAVAAPSCGGLVEASLRAAHDDEGRADDDAGVRMPAVTADAAMPPAKPSPAPPNPVLRCAFKEGPWLLDAGTGGPAVDLVVHEENGEPAIYLTTGTRAVRYRLASANPCVLENATGVAPGAPSASGYVAVGDDGTVWRSLSNKLRRLSPVALPNLECTVGPGYLDVDGSVLYEVGPLLLDEGGKSGWGLDGPPGRLGRLTLGTDVCSVELADSPWGDLPVRASTARDAKGRFHLRDAQAGGGIGIYTGTGKLVSTYSGKSAASDPPPFDVTACGGGVCVLGLDASGQSVLYLDDDGNPRAPALPLIAGLRVHRIAAARSGGAVFIAGASDPSLEALHQVVVQLAPPPP